MTSRRSPGDKALFRRAQTAERELTRARRRIEVLELKLGSRVDEPTLFEADERGYRRGFQDGRRARSRKPTND